MKADTLGEKAAELYNELAEDIFDPLCRDAYSEPLYPTLRLPRMYLHPLLDYFHLLTVRSHLMVFLVFLQLGNAYAKNNEKEKASEAYNRILSLYPDGDIAQLCFHRCAVLPE